MAKEFLFVVWMVAKRGRIGASQRKQRAGMCVVMRVEQLLLLEIKRCIILIISVLHGRPSIYPFLNYGSDAPSIRSLFLFIGTKIHAKYGVVLLFDLEKRKLKRIKIAMNQMISALTIHNSYLVASGSCKGISGNISFCKIDESIEGEKYIGIHVKVSRKRVAI